MSNSNSNKKAKKMSNDSAYDELRQYILSCPAVPSDHPYIIAALKGLEQEKQRQERDKKLQQKFSAQKATSSEEPVMVTYSYNANNAVEAKQQKSAMKEEEEDDDWHNVNREDDKDEEQTMQTSTEVDPSHQEQHSLGHMLAQPAIALVARHNVTVQSPLAAIAVALHAALVNDILDFHCTGIPEDTSAIKGFAAPIRDLPKTQFLPNNWAKKDSSIIRLRYRKDGLGSIVLQVSQKDQAKIEVSLRSTSSSEPTKDPFQFSLGDHFNSESWNKALSSSPGGVSPTLHYKSLSSLLALLSQHFDLGAVKDNHDDNPQQNNKPPYMDTTVQNLPTRVYGTTTTTVPIIQNNDPLRVGSVESAFPGLRLRPAGDFDGDLMVRGFGGGNPMDPLGVYNDPHHMGNLMGPNHPSFRMQQQPPPPGGMPPEDDPAFNGFGGMRPRFDPYGPPPTDPNNGLPQQAPGRRGGRGNPNPDHLPPPNSFGNNMFM